MKSVFLTIANRNGLHARPASLFVACARSYESCITVTRPDTSVSVNAKSIVKLLTLGAVTGTRIRIDASGPDEDEAVEALAALVNCKFDED